MPQPDAQRAGLGTRLPEVDAPSSDYQHDGTASVVVLEAPSEIHNRWQCCATGRLWIPCPRCCRCLTANDCEHPW